MYSGPTPDNHESILMVMREDSKKGWHSGEEVGNGEKIVELQETSEISNSNSNSSAMRTPTTAASAMWEEWDM